MILSAVCLFMLLLLFVVWFVDYCSLCLGVCVFIVVSECAGRVRCVLVFVVRCWLVVAVVV